MHLIHSDALEVLKDIETFDILIIGGSGGDLPLIIEEAYQKLRQNGRIIVTSILLETPVEAVETMQKLNMDIDVVSVSISKGNILERGTMMLARNPITIVTGKK